MEEPVRSPDGRLPVLIETFGWSPDGGFARLPAHLARMRGAATALRLRWPEGEVARALAGIEGAGPLRVRLTLSADGPRVETTPAPAPAAAWRVALAGARLRSDDPWLGVKSAWRPVHDAARAALGGAAEEAILLNERGEVCEGTIASVFLDRGDGVLLTPARGCGLLPGVLRAELLAAGAAREAVLRPEDLAEGRLFLGNALRGLVPGRLVAV